MHHLPKKRRRKNEIRDSIDSDEGEDLGYLNTRQSQYNGRRNILTETVSPQKKPKQSWSTRLVWDPPENSVLGLDADSQLHDDAVEGEVYKSEEEPKTIKKLKRTLRAVGLHYVGSLNFQLIYFRCSRALTNIGVRSSNKYSWMRCCGTMGEVQRVCRRLAGIV